MLTSNAPTSAAAVAAAAVSRKVWFHVDMDGLDAIYQAHGRFRDPAAPDDFYTSAVDNSLAVFADEKIAATYFVIARDLDHPGKRRAIQRILDAGHHVACHGYHHRYLSRSTSDEKRQEVIDARKKIQDALGVECAGFRAPGYSIDFESLELLRDAGYRYDSSIFPSYELKNRLGIERLYPEPFLMFPESGLFEIPMPHVGLGRPPFHPCYAFYLGRPYYHYALRSFRRRFNYLTFLFHLTDFADPQKLRAGFKLNVYTNNFFSRDSKLSFVRKLIKPLRENYAFTTTEELIRRWPESAPDLNPRTLMGVSTTHETGACVVHDGKVLAAINEERLSRKKLDNVYPPVRSIREVVRISGIDPRSIDAVAISGLNWRDLLPRLWDSMKRDVKDYHALNDYVPHACRVMYRLFYLWRATGYGRVLKFLEQEYGIKPKAYYVEHQQAHASSAFRTGTDDEALIVTADGVGDDLCVTFSRGKGSMIRRLGSFFYPHSFGQFYTACTQVLGFKAGRHEGKITGLSGFGTPDPELIVKVESTIFRDPDGGFRLNKKYYCEGFLRFNWRTLKDLLRGRFNVMLADYRNYKPPLKRLLKGYPRENVAHAFQMLLEREMLRATAHHMPADGAPASLVVAGGVMANVKLNMALGTQLNAKSFYIFPNMGDGGLCVGAALDVHAPPPRPVPDMYLGTDFSEDEIRRTLDDHPELTYTKPRDIARTVAQLLADRKIVARCAGRMEFGPRALGNRSILYYCGDKSVNDWLNQQLNRTEFMPFAPICLAEDADEYFIIPEGQRRPCEFMTLVTRCTEKMKQTCPAAVHVDGTARPQLVYRRVNPDVHAILSAYRDITGISCLINTSFNMHEEPIVRAPQEAISAFRQSHLDYLVLGPFLVSEARKTPAPPTLTAGKENSTTAVALAAQAS